MPKAKLPRTIEPDTKLVHYKSVGVQDAVTLCGHTDWIGQAAGEDTDAPVTCLECISIVSSIYEFAKPLSGDHAA